MPENARDETQLLKAPAQGRCIFTFNVKDFLALAVQYPEHSGIVLAAQSSWSLANLSRRWIGCCRRQRLKMGRGEPLG
jgi:hypothetical protein